MNSRLPPVIDVWKMFLFMFYFISFCCVCTHNVQLKGAWNCTGEEDVLMCRMQINLPWENNACSFVYVLINYQYTGALNAWKNLN